MPKIQAFASKKNLLFLETLGSEIFTTFIFPTEPTEFVSSASKLFLLTTPITFNYHFSFAHLFFQATF